ncbi:hypothetical protein [Actinomyces sp. MRS3W]|uniref:hypothetical protein n=1 Tax=Actinomyces sp. MRS3W TaxID=2800796 RepID=UPI0028FD3BF4|nr:hypothetical protein [Actinomyces sp. MRS3W]MDU0347533.1 hypothetical protein [Actinomyces sp. MRS3W]
MGRTEVSSASPRDAHSRTTGGMRSRLRAAVPWLVVALLTWLVSATAAPAQELGYRVLVEFGALREAVGANILSAAIALGSLPVCCLAALVALGIGLSAGRRRELAWAGAGAGLLLFTVLVLQQLGLHIEHGWFPHEGTFPSGHLAAFLAAWMLWRAAVGAGYRRAVDVGAGVLGSCLAVALLAGTAHTLWDVVGSAALGLAASRIAS